MPPVPPSPPLVHLMLQAAWCGMALGIVSGAVTMPTICFLSAWRKNFRALFFIPVLGVLTGVVCTLVGMG